MAIQLGLVIANTGVALLLEVLSLSFDIFVFVLFLFSFWEIEKKQNGFFSWAVLCTVVCTLRFVVSLRKKLLDFGHYFLLMQILIGLFLI